VSGSANISLCWFVYGDKSRDFNCFMLRIIAICLLYPRDCCAIVFCPFVLGEADICILSRVANERYESCAIMLFPKENLCDMQVS